MTTKIGDRSWTYYPDGKFACQCGFCGKKNETTDARWASFAPTRLYACNPCFEAKRVTPANYPENTQATVEQFKNSAPPQSREAAIAAAHAENMKSAQETRNCIALLVTAINGLTEAVKNVK